MEENAKIDGFSKITKKGKSHNFSDKSDHISVKSVKILQKTIKLGQIRYSGTQKIMNKNSNEKQVFSRLIIKNKKKNDEDKNHTNFQKPNAMSNMPIRQKKKEFFLQSAIDSTYAKNTIKSIGRHNS